MKTIDAMKHLIEAAKGEPAATPRLVNATRSAQRYVDGEEAKTVEPVTVYGIRETTKAGDYVWSFDFAHDLHRALEVAAKEQEFFGWLHEVIPLVPVKQNDAQTVEHVCKVINGHRGYDTSIIDKALPDGTQLFTHPAPATEPVNPSGEREALIVRQKEMAKIMSDYGYAGCAALLVESIDMLAADSVETEQLESDYTDQVLRALKAEEALAAPELRDQFKSGEREALIASLRWWTGSDEVGPLAKKDLAKAIDMLAADAEELALYQGTLESRDRNISDVVKENIRLQAQQVAVPQTMMVSTAPSYEFANGWNACIANMLAAPQPPQADAQKTGDAHHKIGVKSEAAKGCGDCFLQDCDYPNCMPMVKGKR